MNVLTLHDIEGEARVLDEDLAERLGMASRTDIRHTLIKRHADELATYGGLRQLVVNSGGKVGRPSKGYYLNEEQALLVAMFSGTPKAAEVRREVIRVFTAWRRGELTPSRPSALAHDDGMVLVGQAMQMFTEGQREMLQLLREMQKKPTIIEHEPPRDVPHPNADLPRRVRRVGYTRKQFEEVIALRRDVEVA